MLKGRKGSMEGKYHSTPFTARLQPAMKEFLYGFVFGIIIIYLIFKSIKKFGAIVEWDNATFATWNYGFNSRWLH